MNKFNYFIFIIVYRLRIFGLELNGSVTKDDLTSRGNGGKTGMTMKYFEYSLNSIIYSFFDSFTHLFIHILFYFIKFRKL